MPTSPTSSGLRDNHTRGTVADFLKGKIQDGSRLSVVSAYFTIYAYDALKSSLDSIEHLDFLFGEPSFVNRLDPSKTEKKAFIIDADGLALSNKLQQKRVAKECADWIEAKVDIKTIKQSNLLHGKMYYIANGGVEDAILGSSNFTVRGLGLGNSGNNIELNLIVDGNRDRQELKQWFDEIWGNDTLVKDVKQDVLNYLKQLYENNTPEFIYYKTLFHIFEKFLGDEVVLLLTPLAASLEPSTNHNATAYRSIAAAHYPTMHQAASKINGESNPIDCQLSVKARDSTSA